MERIQKTCENTTNVKSDGTNLWERKVDITTSEITPQGAVFILYQSNCFPGKYFKKICLKNDIRGHNLVQYISPSKHLPGFFVNYRIRRLREWKDSVIPPRLPWA